MPTPQQRWQRTLVFIRTWRRLARLSLVDALGSAEYRRVLRTWNAAGQPLRCRQLILGWVYAPA